MELAPVYDASSASGRGGEYTRKLALPVGNAEHPDELHAEDVEWLVQGTSMSGEEARAAARTIGEALPDAIAGAVAEAKEEDRIGDRHAAAGEARKRALQEDTRARCGRTAMVLRSARGSGRRGGAGGREPRKVEVFPFAASELEEFPGRGRCRSGPDVSRRSECIRKVQPSRHLSIPPGPGVLGRRSSRGRPAA